MHRMKLGWAGLRCDRLSNSPRRVGGVELSGVEWVGVEWEWGMGLLHWLKRVSVSYM